MDEQRCPDCGGPLECVTTANCKLCPWEFSHPDEDAAIIELKAHLRQKHDRDVDYETLRDT
jgi:hypothetical protein